MEDAVDILDGLGGEPLFAEAIIIALDGMRGEDIKLYSAQTGFNSGFDYALVVVHGSRLHTA